MIVVTTWSPMSTSVRDLLPLIFVTTFGDMPVFDWPEARPPSIEVTRLTVTSAASPTGHSRTAATATNHGRFGKRHPVNGTIHGGSPCYAARRFSPSRPAMVPRHARRTDRRTASRLGIRPRRSSHAHRRADRIRQDARRLPVGARRPLLREPRRSRCPTRSGWCTSSPLKALSADIHKNLAEPRRGIRLLAEEAGLLTSRITAAVRTGDTPQSERAAMLRTPPHILVTTPESLYLLLTSERSRNMLRTARTVIVDEIHAVIGTRRGAHLALSLERLRQVCDGPLLRLGLSATQKPLDEVATFLVGGRAAGAVHDRGRGASPGHGPRGRAAALLAGRRHGPRGLGGVLRPARSADRRPPHDAGIRQHEADGGAAGATPQRPAGRRSGHRSSRQPVEGEAARRRNTAEVRCTAGARRHRVAGAGHRHRPRRSRLSDRLPAPHRDPAAAGRPLRAHRRRPAQGAALSGHP